ncbi:Hypothetical_protein [Hexamita inflata]|uniref:Hypothetical_protein n=1 Tax=Hexamita inflata TaxID=28002 RepID=A0ABP1GSU3_9EUKA
MDCQNEQNNQYQNKIEDIFVNEQGFEGIKGNQICNVDIRRIHHSRLRGMGFGFKFNNQQADSNVRKNSIMLGSLWWMVWQMMSDTSFFLLILRIPNLHFFHTLLQFRSVK